MRIYTIHKTQRLPISQSEAWEFLSNPSNLAIITPPSMKFQTISGDDRKIFPGQIIHYFITPILKFKMQWVTEITHVRDGEYFVDEQRFGPYAFWHHKHFIKTVPGGVEIEDIVHYKLPFGWLGQFGHYIFVGNELEKIFSYRKSRLSQLFGELETQDT